MTVCGSCGGVIGSDFWTGTSCACVPKTARHGAAMHEALLEGWDFTLVDGGVPICTADVRAILGVERLLIEDPRLHDPFNRWGGDALTKDYRLTIKEMDPVEFDRLYRCHPLPDAHRYGPHATDPYAPGTRRRRR